LFIDSFSLNTQAMKKVLGLVLLVALLGSCTNYNTGELVGVQGRNSYIEPDPHGMLFIPAGSFTMGPSDQDIAWTQNSVARTVSVDAFWMDETEITNNEYRQYVHWIRDSIIRKELAKDVDDFMFKNKEGQPVVDRDKENRINWDTPMSEILKDDNLKLRVYGDPANDDPGMGIYYSGVDQLSPRG
jgi:sulfatase modifying factor 1